MSKPPLPKIDRRVPKYQVYFIAIFFYIIIFPINWLLTKLGLGPWAIKKMSQKGNGPKGFPAVFRDYTPDAHDVFVSTFAKSGTNWMMQLSHQIVFHGEGEYEHIHDVIPWPDMQGKMQQKTLLSLDDKLVQQASPENLRVIKTHLPAFHVPYDEKAHYLVVVRDPKEVFVSSYYFGMSSFGPLMPTVEVWFDLFLTDYFPLGFGGSWAEHTASYWALKNKPGVLILSFTEMKKDLPDAAQQVTDCLGLSLSASEMEQVIEKSSFPYMSNLEHKFVPVPKGTLPWGEGFKMMREGKIGNSGELISLEQQMRIDEYCQNELKRLGSDFPYGDFFQIAGTSTS
jgi:hypothetical protein